MVFRACISIVALATLGVGSIAVAQGKAEKDKSRMGRRNPPSSVSRLSARLSAWLGVDNSFTPRNPLSSCRVGVPWRRDT